MIRMTQRGGNDMGQLGKYLRKTTHGYMHWCPGCKHLHHINVEVRRENGAVWTFDGNIERPTFAPSVNHLTLRTDSEGDPILKDGKYQWEPLCHYFIRKGRIEYCGDCKHALSGRTVPLPELPEDCRD